MYHIYIIIINKTLKLQAPAEISTSWLCLIALIHFIKYIKMIKYDVLYIIHIILCYTLYSA